MFPAAGPQRWRPPIWNAGPAWPAHWATGSANGACASAATAPIVAMSLLSSPAGHLTNLSAIPQTPDADGDHAVPLFAAAADPLGRQGFVRVVNRAGEAGTVTIAAYHDSDRSYSTRPGRALTGPPSRTRRNKARCWSSPGARAAGSHNKAVSSKTRLQPSARSESALRRPRHSLCAT